MNKDADELLAELMAEAESDTAVQDNPVLDSPTEDYHLAKDNFESSGFQNSTIEEELTFPFIEVVGLAFEIELKYLMINDDSPTAIPLRIKMEESYVDVGKINLTLGNILHIMSIKEYQLILHESREESSDVTKQLLNTLMLT